MLHLTVSSYAVKCPSTYLYCKKILTGVFQKKYTLNVNSKIEKDIMKFAIPLAKGILTMHFGHAKEFVIIDVEGNQIKNKKVLEPPPHAPGVLPKWLKELGVEIIIAGGMGESAAQLFDECGIEVITGAPTIEPEKLIRHYLDNTLLTTFNACDHKGDGH